jgi:hypothetical protein
MQKFGPVAIGILVSAGFGLTLLHSYLLFHSLAEMFSISIGFAIFIIAWNLRKSMSHRMRAP